MRGIRSIVLGVLVAAGIALAPSAFAGTVEFSPISQSVALGNQASIRVLPK